LRLVLTFWVGWQIPEHWKPTFETSLFSTPVPSETYKWFYDAGIERVLEGRKARINQSRVKTLALIKAVIGKRDGQAKSVAPIATGAVRQPALSHSGFHSVVAPQVEQDMSVKGKNL